MNPPPDDFDALFEASLHTYANAEPRQGLEPRILNRTQAAAPAPASTSQPHPLQQYWGWLATAVAPGILAAILFYPHPRPSTVILSQNPINAVPATPSASPIVTPIRSPHHVSHRRTTLSEPDLASLAPTTQEKLLTQFVSAHRSEALSVAKAQAALDQPITVRPLAIQPIQAQPIQFQPIQFQPISTEPILMGSIHIDSHSNPPSF